MSRLLFLAALCCAALTASTTSAATTTTAAAPADGAVAPPRVKSSSSPFLSVFKRNMMKKKKTTGEGATVIMPLPPVRVNPKTITISGFDSGAIFANQMQIAHSATVKAAGLVSGVPFMCSQGTLIGATACVENPLAITNSVLMAQTLTFQTMGLVDGLTHLQNQYTLVFGSPVDVVVGHLATERMVQLLSSLGAQKVETLYNYSTAGHAWITGSSAGGGGNNPCSYNGAPYINDCGLDFGTVFLKRALDHMGVRTTPLPSTLADAATTTTKSTALPDLILFNQEIFGASVLGNSMDTAGYAFVPPQCFSDNNENSNNMTTPLCHIHLHFHGCDQSRTTMGNGYVSRTGLTTQWAVDNNIIILFPQAAPNALKYNPMGCWDWFNYNNENYYTNWGEFATKKGVQMRIINHILTSVVAGQ